MNSDSPTPPPPGKKLIVFLVLILIVLGALNFWGVLSVKSILVQQTDLIRESNQINRNAMEMGDRAYLLATGTQVETTAADGNEQTRLIPEWQNAGNTPADPVYFEVRCPIIVEKNQEIPKQQMQTPAGQQLQAPDKPISYIKATLAPKQGVPGGACIFTRDQLVLLLPSKPHLFLTARAIYHDVFPGSPLHITEYCSETIPVKGPDNKITFQISMCHKFNCADDQCPEAERKEVEKEYGGK